MTALDRIPTYAGAETPRTEVATRIQAIVLRVARAVFNRRHIGNLAELSDHQLADIGLVRTDLHQAAATPFTADPTSTLARIRQSRTEAKPGRRTS